MGLLVTTTTHQTMPRIIRYTMPSRSHLVPGLVLGRYNCNICVTWLHPPMAPLL